MNILAVTTIWAISSHFGYHLRYFMESPESILGCMLFSGAAKAIRARDQWIGWGANERLRNLSYVVNNGRFLIFPWVKVRYLASHALGKVVRQFWTSTGSSDGAIVRFYWRVLSIRNILHGTSYQAANFQHLGMSQWNRSCTTGQALHNKSEKDFRLSACG